MFDDYKAELHRYIEFAESVLSLKIENSVRSALETAISNARAELEKNTADGYSAVSTPLRTFKVRRKKRLQREPADRPRR